MKKYYCLVLILLFTVNSYSQGNQFTYNFGGNFVNNKLFIELENDLDIKITANSIQKEYSYLQYLVDQNFYKSLCSKVVYYDEKKILDSLFIGATHLVEAFPLQSVGYYFLSKYFLSIGNTDKAIDVLNKSVFVYGVKPEKYQYLLKLFGENVEFTNGFQKINDKWAKLLSQKEIDSSIIVFMDSIKFYDRLDREAYMLEPSNPRFIKQAKLDSINAVKLKGFVLKNGWISKFLGRDYDLVYVPVMHFSIPDKFFLLDSIISDCKKNKASWIEAEFIVWKIAYHPAVNTDDCYYNVIPLIYLDPLSGSIDLFKSLLGIKASVDAFTDSSRLPITIFTTSKHPEENRKQNLETLKKYFLILGLKDNQVLVSNEVLDKNIEEKLPYVPLFVVKR
ncbi:MAG: hypothetical protein AB7S48_09890 [Bacteroidales bacterium]